jgi:hypothetical protein
MSCGDDLLFGHSNLVFGLTGSSDGCYDPFSESFDLVLASDVI